MDIKTAVDKYLKKYPDGYLSNILTELKEEDLLEEEIVDEEITRALYHKGAVTPEEVTNWNKIRKSN